MTWMSSLLTNFLPCKSARAFEASINPMDARGDAPYSMMSFFSRVAVMIPRAYFFISFAMGTSRTRRWREDSVSLSKTFLSWLTARPSVKRLIISSSSFGLG